MPPPPTGRNHAGSWSRVHGGPEGSARSVFPTGVGTVELLNSIVNRG
jgi:hypothetical protein